MFCDRVNMETVSLDKVETDDDLAWLKDTVEDFQRLTGSVVAAEVLERWPASAKQFFKVGTHFSGCPYRC